MISDHQSILLSLSLLFFAFLLHILSLKRNNKPKPHFREPPSPPALPIIGHLHLLKPLVHQAFRDLSEQHGPLVLLRLGSVRFVVASTPSLAREFLKTHELAYSFRKTSTAINTVIYDNATFAFSPHGDYWKFIKKLSTTELLGNRTIGQFLPIRAREVHEFIWALENKSKAQESVNLTQELLKLSNNIISKMMLSIKSSGTDGQAEQARALVREVTEIFGEFNVSDFIGIFKNLDLQGFKKRAMHIQKRYDALLEKIISDREESRRKEEGRCEINGGEEKVRDFLDMLLDFSEEKDCEVSLTRNHIKSVILVNPFSSLLTLTLDFQD